MSEISDISIRITTPTTRIVTGRGLVAAGRTLRRRTDGWRAPHLPDDAVEMMSARAKAGKEGVDRFPELESWMPPAIVELQDVTRFSRARMTGSTHQKRTGT
jgi:hypothetical protein